MRRISIALLPLLLSSVSVNAIAQDVVPGGSKFVQRSGNSRIELGIMGGAIAPVGWNPEAEYQGLWVNRNNAVVGGQGAIDLRMSWPVGGNTRIGFRLGLGAGGLEWQCWQEGDNIGCLPDRIDSDDVPDGEDYVYRFGVQPTLIPQLGFLLAYDTSKWFTFEVTTGFGAVIPVTAFRGGATDAIPWGNTPLLSVGLAGTFTLGATQAADIGLSVRLDVFFSYRTVYLLPQAGLVVRF